MSLHSYSRVWLHLVWATLECRPLLDTTTADTSLKRGVNESLALR